MIFQAMDTAGKDGAIEHVHVRREPAGLPGAQLQAPERRGAGARLPLAHDAAACRSGARSASSTAPTTKRCWSSRVHPEILEARAPARTNARTRTIWQHRYESIIDHEQHLHRNGTRIIKFFLHVSKKEQRKRFLSRIDDPNKRWKFSPADLVSAATGTTTCRPTRACLERDEHRATRPGTSCRRTTRRTRGSSSPQVILSTLESLQPEFPTISQEREKELERARS